VGERLKTPLARLARIIEEDFISKMIVLEKDQLSVKIQNQWVVQVYKS